MNEPEVPQQPADPPPGAPEPPVETQSFIEAMQGVWERIKHHKVVQWTFAYLAIAYTLLHGAEMLTGSLGWPHSWVRLFTLLLILGVPIVVTLAWYHGARGQQRASGTEIMIIPILLALGGAFAD
jgi:serine/threonine-protein kinase